jgi:Flp pilus assembly pilin Flp
MLEYFQHRLALVFDRRGVTALEYAMIGGLIVVAIAAGFSGIGVAVATRFTSIGTDI